uniref:Uncharacterized protein n=1 Tax=Romanomermis culicivorax TaxID=13658 RepID=A0A915IA39_ROMCU
MNHYFSELGQRNCLVETKLSAICSNIDCTLSFVLQEILKNCPNKFSLSLIRFSSKNFPTSSSLGPFSFTGVLPPTVVDDPSICTLGTCTCRKNAAQPGPLKFLNFVNNKLLQYTYNGYGVEKARSTFNPIFMQAQGFLKHESNWHTC